MAAMDSEHIKALEEALESWTDSRFVSAEEIRDLAIFHNYLVNLAEDDGWEYTGHSLSLGSPMSRLVVRGVIDGVAHVVFTSNRTTTGCIRSFLRKMQEGWLEWSVDRFR